MATIRPAQPGDHEALGRLAAGLVRMHHSLDQKRFFLIEPIEEGYARWLGKEMKNPEAVVLAAEQDGAVVGYAYGTLEERNWPALLDACGAIHDVFVDPAARRGGIARALIEALCARLTELGAPQIVLSTAERNEAAQKLFEAMGFRRTMVEFTREA